MTWCPKESGVLRHWIQTSQWFCLTTHVKLSNLIAPWLTLLTLGRSKPNRERMCLTIRSIDLGCQVFGFWFLVSFAGGQQPWPKDHQNQQGLKDRVFICDIDFSCGLEKGWCCFFPKKSRKSYSLIGKNQLFFVGILWRLLPPPGTKAVAFRRSLLQMSTGVPLVQWTRWKKGAIHFQPSLAPIQ